VMVKLLKRAFQAKLHFFKFLFIIYFWPFWVFLAAHRLSLVAASRGYSSSLDSHISCKKRLSSLHFLTFPLQLTAVWHLPPPMIHTCQVFLLSLWSLLGLLLLALLLLIL